MSGVLEEIQNKIWSGDCWVGGENLREVKDLCVYLTSESAESSLFSEGELYKRLKEDSTGKAYQLIPYGISVEGSLIKISYNAKQCMYKGDK